MSPKNTRSHLWLLLPVLVLAVGCEKPVQDKVAAAPPVVLTPVSVQDVEERIELSGELIARHRARLAAEVTGRISRIVFDESESVEEGDVILEIDPERRELELASARARMAEASATLRERDRDFQRLRTLHENQIASDARLSESRSQLEATRARVAAARAEVKIAERAVRDAKVRAPFSGRIVRRLISRGEFVNVGVPLLDLVALDPIQVEFFVSERDSGRVSFGQEVLLRVDPFPDELFSASVTMVSPSIDPETHTLRVLAVVDNSEGRLRPGLFARGDLGVALRPDILMVPEEAVLLRAEGAMVYRLVADNRVERVAVETGTHREGFVEVRKGLGPTDLVATRGHASLLDGTRISPRNLDGTPISASLADVNAMPPVGATP